MQGHPSQLLADPLPLIIKTFEKLTFYQVGSTPLTKSIIYNVKIDKSQLKLDPFRPCQ